MKKTAVEWLVDEILSGKLLIPSLIEQAKEMEREQIIEAYENGDSNGADRVYYHSDKDDKSAEQYYNETLKIKK